MTTPTQRDQHAAMESYAAGPADTPPLRETIGENFLCTSSKYPDVEAATLFKTSDYRARMAAVVALSKSPKYRLSCPLACPSTSY